jgi:GWxTD domain-containing protein
MATASAQQAAGGHAFFDAVPFAGPTADSAQLDLYLAIPYNAISFERMNGIYVGRYQARVKVEGNGRTWYDSSFSRTSRTPSYDATVGREPAFDFYQQRVMLPAGSYTASLDLVDLRTNLVTPAKKVVTASGYSGVPFAISGLLLVKKIREEGGSHVITPMISETVPPDEDGYFLFFEAYNNGTGNEKFRIDATYKSSSGKQAGTPLAFEKSIPAGRSQQWVRMPTTTMPRGSFTVTLRVTPAADTSKTLASAERSIRIEGSVNAVSLDEEELNDKIAQLRYVGTTSEIDQIQEATALADRQRRYAEFWSRLDPSPGTAVNEAMDEYNRRVDYAEAHFRSYAAGWLTDKGRVYIIFGAPDNTANDPFRTDSKVVETWQYYNRNLRLTFVDETGFGDFRLTTPLPPGEKFHYDE